MARIILQHPSSGIIKKAPVGFSWTTLLFGPLPAIFRGDIKWFCIQFIANGLLIIPYVIFPFIYNKLYIKKCLEAGYKAKAVEGDTLEALNAKLGLELPLLHGKDS